MKNWLPLRLTGLFSGVVPWLLVVGRLSKTLFHQHISLVPKMEVRNTYISCMEFGLWEGSFPIPEIAGVFPGSFVPPFLGTTKHVGDLFVFHGEPSHLGSTQGGGLWKERPSSIRWQSDLFVWSLEFGCLGSLSKSYRRQGILEFCGPS